MNYLLDTNICIHFFRGKFGVIEKIESNRPENFAISEITLAELVFGAENSKNPKKNHRLDIPVILTPQYGKLTPYRF